MTLLQVQQLGKAYRTYHSEWHRLGVFLGLPLRPKSTHWALRGVSFSVTSGEAIGIIGANGAGKSTLLKLITGTLAPSEGSIKVNGRIAAILELGLGFNPNLNGRENAIQAAGLMGIAPETIQKLLPAIEDFAEIGRYFGEPVRTYSSGMQARLAFSVATALRPDLLIVDEALAVGDAYFVHKCIRRIREFQNDGTSLLVVAHDSEAIRTLCDRVLLLNRGECLMLGEPEPVLDYYNALIAEQEKTTIRQAPKHDGRIQTTSGTGEAQVSQIRMVDEKGRTAEEIKVGEMVTLEVLIKVHQPLENLVFGYLIKDRLGHSLFGSNTHHLSVPMKELRAGESLTLRIAFKACLGPGSYSITTALHTDATHISHNYEWQELALVFLVANAGHPLFMGTHWLPPTVNLER